MKKEQVLQDCKVEGNVVKLPNIQLDRKDYQEVAKALELIGGKWKGGKIMGFVFSEDPTDLLAQIANGEKRNLKKEFQFFATPDDIADWLVELAEIKDSDNILEPEAGQAAIVRAINRVLPSKKVYCYELMPVNQIILRKNENVIFCGEDFLAPDENKPFQFHKIIANPPFSKNQDIDHIREMYVNCTTKGRIVSMASKHWQNSSNKKETAFREWLKELNAKIYEVESGKFKESGTMISTCVIVIDKV